jgi:dTDP-L-rhamnose 4-epimerase
MNVLITGGAGFIGSHLSDELLARGHRVRAFDLLSCEVHGEDCERPEYLDADVELIRGDVRDGPTLRRALDGVEVVYHFAAAVGVGPSLCELAHYTSTNSLGTAVLLQELVARPIRRLIVASSMNLYGEGRYTDRLGGVVPDAERTVDQLQAGEWELRDADGASLEPQPTPETTLPCLSSVSALSKFHQERLSLMIGRACGIPTIALRFCNVFGTRQTLSSRATSVPAIFASRLLNDRPPLIFEDGMQRRDFVSVYDVVQACRLAMDCAAASGRAFNIGSGEAHTVREIADVVAAVLAKPIPPEVCGRYRAGDVRHCFADITLARQVLGYEPAVTLEDGLIELAEWLSYRAADDPVADADRALPRRGLAVWR